MLTRTGARFVIGVSSRTIIAMEAALALPAIEKLAILEPPLAINGVPDTWFLERYDQEMARGDVTGALVTGRLGAQMGPLFMHQDAALAARKNDGDDDSILR